MGKVNQPKHNKDILNNMEKVLASLIPATCRGIKRLDKELFCVKVCVPALRVPVKSIGQVQKQFKDELFNAPRLRNVIGIDGDKEYKLVLLKNSEIGNEIGKEFSPEFKKKMESEGWELKSHTVIIDYSYWTAEDVLKAILPTSNEAPTSFEQVGHIAHMNLREEYFPYKEIIGKVILDKSANIKTVVNKLDSIDSEFRFFKMEVLAGEHNLLAKVKEQGCYFKFDFSKVYWNSRLQGEHERLVKKFKKTDIICDVMAGVGPFSIPAAKNIGCQVYANDLNPSSYSSLVENIEINKVGKKVKAYNMDGRQFIRQSFKELLDACEDEAKTFNHVLMNLPATAIEFLDAFNGVYSGYQTKVFHEGRYKNDFAPPTIHVHCFTKCAEDPNAEILERAKVALGLEDKYYAEFCKDAIITYVRSVAPNKNMYCLSFELPASVALGNANPYQSTNNQNESCDSENSVEKADNIEERPKKVFKSS